MRKVAILGLAICAALTANAQMGAKFEQYYMDFSMVNPAAMNAHKDGHISLLGNRMFSAVPGGPQQTVLNFNMPVPSKNTGYGLFYMRERVGFSEMHNAYASYVYSVPLGGTTNLNMGVSVGALRQSFDLSKAIYMSGNDDIIKSLMIAPPVTRADLRASAFINGDNWFGGLAISRLSNPTFDYTYYQYTATYQLQSQSTLLLGANLDVGGDLVIKPSVLVSGYNWDYYRVQFNASAWYQDKLWIGFNANDIGQIGGNIGFKPQPDVRISYSYVTPTGSQRVALGNTHEFHTFIGFSALGGGSRNSGSGSGDDGSDNTNGDGSDNGEDGEGGANLNRTGGKGGNGGAGEDGGNNGGTFNPDRSTVTVFSIEDLRKAGLGRDTSLLKLQDVPKVKPGPGFYLVAGLHTSEAKANKHVKDLYKKGVIAFKFYDPTNKSFYVYLKDFATENEANKGMFYYEASVPSVWVREIK